MEGRYLFLFELLVRLISMLLKIHSLVIPSHSSFCISPSLSPSAARSFSQWYLCLFVSVHFILLARGVIHCLHLSLFSLSPLSLCVSVPLSLSLSLLSSKIWHGIETGERLLFLWHTLPFWNQNQLRRNQVITSAVFFFSPAHPFSRFFVLKVYEILHFEKKQRAAGQSEKRARAGSDRGLLHKSGRKKYIQKHEMDVWRGSPMCAQLFVCLCEYACLPVANFGFVNFSPSLISTHSHTCTESNVVVLAVWPGLLWSDICDFLFSAFIWGQK